MKDVLVAVCILGALVSVNQALWLLAVGFALAGVQAART